MNKRVYIVFMIIERLSFGIYSSFMNDICTALNILRNVLQKKTLILCFIFFKERYTARARRSGIDW